MQRIFILMVVAVISSGCGKGAATSFAPPSETPASTGQISSSPAAAQLRGASVSNDRLRESCSKKTIVFNRQGERTGEGFDPFCHGYLQATLDALSNQVGNRCKISSDQSAEYLLSVYQKYIADKRIPGSESASQTLFAAYRRAFDCGAD
jgi:hypothetical protein